jgi:predicted ester cyclase
MSRDENKALVRRFFEALSYDGNLAVLDDLCGPTYTHRIGGESHSLTWLKDIVSHQFRAGFPDIGWAVEDLIAEGDKVWARSSLRGTHLGTFQANPPTGKIIRIEDCINIFLVANGRLVEDEVLWRRGFLEIFEQIGGVPPQ